MGAAPLDRHSIIVAGGIYGDTDMTYQYVNSVYKLELHPQPKWVKAPKMNAKRTLFSTLPFTHSSGEFHIYAIGASQGENSEVFDARSGKWWPIAPYNDILPNNDL